jgi:hypothetical protein
VNFEIWKTIRIGTASFKTADDFRKALKEKGFYISRWANDILEKPAFTVAPKETQVDLFKVTVSQLGFQSAQLDQIYGRAEELGLELCPAEVGPQLCLQYQQDQPNEWILVAMKPILDSLGNLRVFNVGGYGSELWLRTYLITPGNVWDPHEQWVFCK